MAPPSDSLFKSSEITHSHLFPQHLEARIHIRQRAVLDVRNARQVIPRLSTLHSHEQRIALGLQRSNLIQTPPFRLVPNLRRTSSCEQLARTYQLDGVQTLRVSQNP
jgi:hypothetical protein